MELYSCPKNSSTALKRIYVSYGYVLVEILNWSYVTDLNLSKKWKSFLFSSIISLSWYEKRLHALVNNVVETLTVVSFLFRSRRSCNWKSWRLGSRSALWTHIWLIFSRLVSRMASSYWGKLTWAYWMICITDYQKNIQYKLFSARQLTCYYYRFMYPV